MIFLHVLDFSLFFFMDGKDLKFFDFFLFLEVFVLKDFFFFLLIKLLKLEVLIHVIPDLFFSVKFEICNELIFDFEVIFTLAPVPNFDKITVIFFVPSKILSQRINFVFSFFHVALCYLDLVYYFIQSFV
jgi:hypothetical protein